MLTRKEKCEMAVRKGFTYNELTGLITTPTGKTATKVSNNGYVSLTIRENRKAFYLFGHQFAWYFTYSECVDFLDHKNRIKTDNRIDNLRSVTKSQNSMNRSNVKGYYYSRRSNKFIAYIMVNYKTKQLGVFNTPEEAQDCYLKNKNKYHIIN